MDDKLQELLEWVEDNMEVMSISGRLYEKEMIDYWDLIEKIYELKKK